MRATLTKFSLTMLPEWIWEIFFSNLIIETYNIYNFIATFMVMVSCLKSVIYCCPCCCSLYYRLEFLVISCFILWFICVSLHTSCLWSFLISLTCVLLPLIAYITPCAPPPFILPVRLLLFVSLKLQFLCYSVSFFFFLFCEGSLPFWFWPCLLFCL